MPLTLPPLSFAKNALEPVMSAETLEYHHGKHHAGYVKKYNAAVEETAYCDLSLEEAVRRASAKGDSSVFNNGAQAFNHAFFWESLAPRDRSGKPGGALSLAIDKAFGSLDGFRETFIDIGSAHFASGWVWLAAEKGGALTVVDTHDAVPIFLKDLTPLLVCDLWEHAYYIDHRNDRGTFLEQVTLECLNWENATSRYAALRATART
ncbi:MAG: superoxide dismutase [Fe] [Alphaproteobacteria bacterium]|nr:superoxide dismutase [Fe] [Alphaproteobacteria bacterium]